MSYISDTSLANVTFIYHLEIMNMDHMLNICNIIAYEMCVLFFKMAADLRKWDDNYVNELCDLTFGQFLLGNMYRYAANDHVWEEITHTLNAQTRKAFSKRQVIRKFASLQRWYRIVTGVHRYSHFGNVHQCLLLIDYFMIRLSKRWMPG